MHFTREPGALVVVEVGVVHRQHRHRPPASGGKRRHLRGEGGLAGALQAGDAVNAGAAGQRIIEAAGDEVGWKARCDAGVRTRGHRATRSEEHTSELQSLMRISYAVFCLKKKKNNDTRHNTDEQRLTTKYPKNT